MTRFGRRSLDCMRIIEGTYSFSKYSYDQKTKLATGCSGEQVMVEAHAVSQELVMVRSVPSSDGCWV